MRRSRAWVPRRPCSEAHAALARRGPGTTAFVDRRLRLEPDRRGRASLPARNRLLFEADDRVLIHAMKVEPRAKAQERAAKTDRRPLEKHEFARHRQASAFGLKSAHHLANLASAIFRGLHAIGGRAHAIIENRATNETPPDGHRFCRAERQPAKPPHLEGVRDSYLVVRLKRPIELDHAVHEPRGEDAHATVVKQIDAIDDAALLPAAGRYDGIIAEMGIAVNDAVAQERAPPCLEQADGDGVARFLRSLLEGGERLPVQALP